MANMSYCRHENTKNDLWEVIDEWNEFDAFDNEYEVRGRLSILKAAAEIVTAAQNAGVMDGDLEIADEDEAVRAFLDMSSW